MVKKRLIPCLDVAGGRVVKGVRFLDLREVGDPIELAARSTSPSVGPRPSTLASMSRKTISSAPTSE